MSERTATIIKAPVGPSGAGHAQLENGDVVQVFGWQVPENTVAAVGATVDVQNIHNGRWYISKVHEAEPASE